MNGQDVGVWRLPKGGGVAERIYAGAVVRAIAVDEAFVYTGSVPSNDAAQLVRIPKSGGAPSALAQTLVLGAIALDEENVYWTTWGGPTSTPGNVLRISKQGGAVEVIHDGEPGVVAGVAVDDSHVYWTSQQAGAVRARPKAGGATLTLATGQGTTETVVTSGPWIFWVNFDDSSVWRAAKP
jgi:sugar lactone lactonase YvrE